MNPLKFSMAIAIMACIGASCSEESVEPSVIDTFDTDYSVSINPSNFTEIITNPYLPFTVGSTFTYTGETEEGTERIQIEVLAETKVVMGVTCTVVRDIVYLNDEIIEDTHDWFAQDEDGNVWYFGEEVDNYENGVVDNNDGAWEAGINGALPGIAMLANPVIGLLYRQEYFKGEAEDRAEVISFNETVTTPAGTFTGCLKIRETTPLEPEVEEYKFYALGIGVVLESKEDEKAEIIQYDVKD